MIFENNALSIEDQERMDNWTIGQSLVNISRFEAKKESNEEFRIDIYYAGLNDGVNHDGQGCIRIFVESNKMAAKFLRIARERGIYEMIGKYKYLCLLPGSIQRIEILHKDYFKP